MDRTVDRGVHMAAEETLVDLRERLVRDYGEHGASYLMDRPPGGWSQLVTIPVLEARLDALRHELRSEMAALRGELRVELHEAMRSQTRWMVGAVIAAQALMVSVLRFA
jgi:hypothetical protein